MQQTAFLARILLAGMLIISQAQKHIIFTKLQCTYQSNKIANIKCFLEQNSAFTVQLTLGKDNLGNLMGISDLNIAKVTHIKGIRLNICTMLDGNMRLSTLSFLYNGIKETDNNLPERCPFMRNVTYTLQHMKFDVNSLPMKLPENNFTFIGKFFSNNVDLFEVRLKGSVCFIGHDCTGGAGVNRTATEI